MKPKIICTILRDRRGSVAVLTAVGLTAMVGFLSLGTEAGQWYATKRSLQSSADAAALGGAFELEAGSNAATIVAAATQDANRNGFQAINGATLTVNSPPKSGKYIGNTQSVEVILSQNQNLLFSSLFLKTTTIGSRAVAQVTSSGASCILALDTTSNAVSISGSTTLSLNNCGITANSTSSQSLVLSGSAKVNAAFVQTSGEYSISGSAELNASSITTKAAPAVDPYANLSAPTPGSCVSVPSGKNFTLNAGTYCNGLNLQGNVTLNPGVYVIKGGSLNVSGQASITGTGVTIILTGDCQSGYATVNVSGGGTVNLTAPTSGTWAGVAFYSDRNGPNLNNSFSGSSSSNITGVIYMPNSDVSFSGGTATASSGCTHLIAYNVTFSGSTSLGDACSGTGVASSSGGKPILVE